MPRLPALPGLTTPTFTPADVSAPATRLSSVNVVAPPASFTVAAPAAGAVMSSAATIATPSMHPRLTAMDLRRRLTFAGLYEHERAIGWATAAAAFCVAVAMAAGALAIPVVGRRPLRRSVKRPGRGFVAALRRREREALDDVYAEYAPTVLGYLVNTLPDRGMAEDVHQQVFLEVWQRAPSYDPERASVLTWIMTIARSRAVDELRRRVPEPRELEGTLGGVADADPERSPDALVERWRVAHLLSRLRDEEAELLRLRFYEGLSQSEIATRTELPLGTVKMRMVAALRRLRDLIDEEEARA